MRQKLCITGETPARKPIMAAAPSVGFTPSRMLAPPITNTTPVADGPLGHGNFLRARILREHIAFFKVIDPAVKEISAEQ